MSSTPSKSRTLILTNRKVDHDAKLYIGTSQFWEFILTTCSNPIKFLAHAISFHLRDRTKLK